ncbi:hypothetical protein D3C77_411630 [compost metagenome]
MGFFLFLFVILALLNIIFPRIGWHLNYGWMVKGNVEPSDAYLLMTRITSVLALIVVFFIWSRFF